MIRPLLLLAVGLAGCGADPLVPVDGGGSGGVGGSGGAGSGGSCMYGGKTYPSGAQFPAADGCNTCVCQSGAAACTEKGCPPRDGGAAVACTVDGKSYPAGASFPSSDGCNTCSCAAGGAVACTLKACACNLDESLSFRDDGGLRIYYDEHEISRDAALTIRRIGRRSDGPAQCRVMLACDADVPAIRKALAHADVVKALAQLRPMLYGRDTRPVDGTIWMFRLMSGRGFDLGAGDVPAGLRELQTVLRGMVDRALKTPACANLGS